MITWKQSEVTTSAYCFRITRTDGVVLGFTSHDKDLIIAGVTYEAATGFTPTAASTSREMSVDNMDVDGIIDSETVTKEDIAAGKYAKAKIMIFECNWANLTDPIFIIRTGTLGEIKTAGHLFTAEIRGLLQAFQQEQGMTYQKNCRQILGDAKCSKDLASFRVAGTITAVNTDGTYHTSLTNPNGYFDYGLLHFTGGNNSGIKYEIKQSLATNGKIVPFLPAIFPVHVGDAFTATAGCDGNLSTCINKFSNVINFRGEPFVPGTDYATNYPSQESSNTVSEGQSAHL